MNFWVRWLRAARDQLATIWLAHSNRNRVTAAAHRIDVLLANDPENEGEDRPNGQRVIFDAPLVVLYRVNTTTNVVTVVGVSQYGAA